MKGLGWLALSRDFPLSACAAMHSHSIDINRARDQLPRLIEQAAQGDEVILTEAGEPVARITPIVRARKPRQFGSARGMIHMADDFDAPLDEFKEYM